MSSCWHHLSFYALVNFKTARIVSLTWTGEKVRKYEERSENIYCRLPFHNPYQSVSLYRDVKFSESKERAQYICFSGFHVPSLST
jgi:hypothetical protein